MLHLESMPRVILRSARIPLTPYEHEIVEGHAAGLPWEGHISSYVRHCLSQPGTMATVPRAATFSHRVRSAVSVRISEAVYTQCATEAAGLGISTTAYIRGRILAGVPAPLVPGSSVKLDGRNRRRRTPGSRHPASDSQVPGTTAAGRAGWRPEADAGNTWHRRSRAAKDEGMAAEQLLRTLKTLDWRLRLREAAVALRPKHSHGTKGWQGAAQVLEEILSRTVSVEVVNVASAAPANRHEGSPSRPVLRVKAFSLRQGLVELDPPPEGLDVAERAAKGHRQASGAIRKLPDLGGVE